MSVQNFIPALWAGSLLSNLNDAHVYKKAFNSDYEGEIKGYGSSVKINSLGRVTTYAYTRNTDINTPEELDIAGQWLLIDQGSYFNFGVDDVDKAQARGDFQSQAMKEAAWSIADDVDDHLAGVLQAGAAVNLNTNLSLTTATIGTGAGELSAWEALVEMQVALDETNTPDEGRKVFVPPFFEGLIRLDERFTSFGTDKSNERLRGAPIAEGAGFMIYKSNNVPRDGSEYSILAGYNGAATMAEQVAETKAFDPERRFGNAVKGLHVWGAKVTRPSNYARFDVLRGQLMAH